jgi:probable rRNA maturation factor
MTVRLDGPPGPSGLPGVDRRLLRSRAVRLLRELSLSRSELSIQLMGDEEIAGLNRTWRGRARATDVLAFPLLEGDHAAHRGALLGDVVIGIETAARQARARHRSLDDEVGRLLVHGTLHLIGHDHVKQAEARRMRAEERRLWRAIR